MQAHSGKSGCRPMTQITSEVLLVKELLTKGQFSVPWHQRYYDWTTEQVGELIIDLKESIEEGRSSYFLGSIMLVESEENVWQINDGQQRLITLSLLIASLCRRFATKRHKEDAIREQLALRLLFDLPEDTITQLNDTSKDKQRIKPPRQDRTQFTQIICGRDIGANGKLTSAWREIETVINTLNPKDGRDFFDFLTGKIEIGVLYVPEMEDANSIFEALNGRGKQLNDVDLIRNYMYSYFTDSSDKEKLNKIHDLLESVLQNNRSQKRSHDYFRCYFQCRYGYLQKNRFYRETRSKIRDSIKRQNPGKHVYDLINDFADPRHVELFRMIAASNLNQEFLSKFMKASSTTRNKRNLKTFISELSGYKVAQPLVFALLRKFIEAPKERIVAKAVHRSLSDLASFIIRVSFSSTKFEPSRFESAFANYAKELGAVKSAEKIDLQPYLRDCDEHNVMSDARFISQIADIELKDTKRARRFLFGINACQDREDSALNIQGCSVEHILPKSSDHWKGWTGFAGTESDINNWVHRIGNLTLLGNSDNFARNKFNANFEAKKSVFAESPFVITRKIISSSDWTPDNIKKRSQKLAREAAHVWSFTTR